MTRRGRCAHLRRLAVLVSTLLLLTSLSQVESHEGHHEQRSLQPRRPVRRNYDSHAYYVLELREGTPYSHARHIAQELQAELVEQVGELRDHYLLRAPFSDRLSRRSLEHSLDTKSEGLDHVMQRYYDLVRYDTSQIPIADAVAGSAEPVSPAERHSFELHARSVPQNAARRWPANAVLSLERQEIRKRVKRQLLPEYLLQHRQNEPMPLSTYIRDVVDRFAMFDPEFPGQWHLINDQEHDHSINVTGVWSQGITGKGIKVAVVDDGLDMHSDDLKDNFYADGSWDYNDHTDLPEPRLSDDQHGTRCAGEIGAVKNDVCGVGVAYDAKVAGIRILSASISDADEASALNFGYQNNDIYSCSWGPPDDGRSMEAPSRLIYKSILNGVQNGRGGKGSIFVFASGNGGAVDDQCNFDGYTNSIFSITISAIDRKGLHPYYSEGCSANMVVTYSSGSGDNIHTTDVGKRKCTEHHGGTSAAAPIAAGIYALALQARPELTWRDLQHITIQSAIQVNLNDPDWQVTHAGRPYNHKYGYGKMDAWRIVELAKTFKLVKPQAWFETPLNAVNSFITTEGVTSIISIKASDLQSANFEKLEHITVTLNADHTRRGDMEVILESPHGIKSILARPRRFDDDVFGFPEWTFMSVKHWDENPVGEWKLTMLDRQNDDKNGTFKDWKMMLWGSCVDAASQKPYKMSDDAEIYLPQPPHHKIPANITTLTTTFVSNGQTLTRTTTVTAAHDLTTKSYLKPTAHLPDNHGQATGESDHPLDGLPTSTLVQLTGTLPDILPTSTPGSSNSSMTEQDSDTSYLGPFFRLADSDTWLYIAAGSIIIFLGATGAYFMYRRQKQRRGFQLLGGGQDGMPMTALDRGRAMFGLAGSSASRARARGTGEEPRAKSLYDAFALSDSDEEFPDIETGNAASSAGGAAAAASRSHSAPGYSVHSVRKMDDSYMTDFLEDEDDGDASAQLVTAESSALHSTDGRDSPEPSRSSSQQTPYRDDV